MKHTDYVTDISNAEDFPYLRTKLLNVNMRLFFSNERYKRLVSDACDLLSYCVLTKAEGYKLPHGFSGANAGIPWNIIAIARSRDTKDAWAEIMINPKIVRASTDMVESESNCGSIRLQGPITVRRHAWVEVSWNDRDGFAHLHIFDRAHGGLTIQHEIDHNQGVLITDRAV